MESCLLFGRLSIANDEASSSRDTDGRIGSLKLGCDRKVHVHENFKILGNSLNGGR